MADETENLAQQMERLREATQRGTSDLDKLSDSAKRTAEAQENFGKNLKNSAEAATKEMGNLAKGLGKGDTSFSQLNGIVDVATGAIAGMAQAIPVIGTAAGAAIKAAGEASKFVIDQLQTTTKVFNDFSAAGALTADGMSGIQKQFLQSGMSLTGFQKAVTDNAQTLARFKGIVGEGAGDFSKFVGSIVDSDAGTELRRLGLSADQIGESAASFLTQQTRLGTSQRMTQDQLRMGTMQYVKELDELSKVTGMNRAAIQKQQDAALSEGKFRAVYDEMIKENRGAEAKSLMALQTRMSTFGDEMGQGVRDLASGATNTAAAQKMLTSTGGAAVDIIDRLKRKEIDENQAQKELQAAYKANQSALQENAKYVGDSNEAFNKYAQVSDFTAANLEKSGEKAKVTADKQIAGADGLTNATVDAQKNMEQMSRQIQALGFSLMSSAAPAIEAFTGALNEFLQFVAETIGADIPGAKKSSTAIPSGGKGAMAGAASMGLAGAAIGSVVPGVGTAIGGVLGGAIGGVAGYFGAIDYGVPPPGSAASAPPSSTSEFDTGVAPAAPASRPGAAPAAPASRPGAAKTAPPSRPGAAPAGAPQPVADLSDLFSFGSNTGSRQNFEKLDPRFKDRLIAAAQEYNTLTDKKLTINSAFRDAADQEKLYKDWEKGGKQGIPVGKPGQSKHNSGMAVDIQNYNDPAAVEAMNNAGLLQTVAKDPVHFSAQYGGVMTGPTSGYTGTLHGPEAVVPLAGGRTIPVEMPGFTDNLRNLGSLMEIQISKFDQMIDTLATNNNISNKILQVSRS